MSKISEAEVRAEVRDVARGQLGSRDVPRDVAQQARRLRLGDAAMARGMVRPRPAGRPRARGGGGICRRWARWAPRKPESGCWRRRRCSSMDRMLQKKKFLRRILTGEDAWCQLFSEPGSGSDLAGATTRADLDGDHWIVNGQKVWTTSAHHADHGLLLARTDWDAPKHEGLSYFVIDIKQPGVDVQPLKQMNGHASFNQVFFTDATIPAENLVGGVGDGWKVAMTTLAHERRGADGLSSPSRRKARTGRIHAEERAELEIANQPYTWYPQRAGRVDLVIERAKETGANKDPVVRQEIAKLMIMAKSAEWTARRARAAQQQGRPQGPEGSLGKLAASNVARAAARVHTMITGAEAMLTGPREPARRDHRGDPGLGARGLDRRRHRRDSAQHYRRARARLTQGAAFRHRPIPQRAQELTAL